MTMPLGDEKILALGNTASVMPSLAKVIPKLYVAYPTDAPSVVLQTNEKCFPAKGLNHPLSVSCYEFVRRMAMRFDFFHSELVYAPACHSAGVRYGIHIHGVTDVRLLFPRTNLGRLLKGQYNDALEMANYVVCHPAVLDVIRTIRRDAVGLPLPVDTTQFSDNVTPFDYGESFTVFSPSRMDQWKGHEIIWDALRLMRNRTRVRIYQSDWGWEPSYSYFKKNAPENVRFIPLVPRQQIASRYRGAVLVMGQMKIGYLGMTELEAVACGVPVLVHLKNGPTPFLPKLGDAQSLAESIDALIEDEGFRMRYAKSCKDFVLPAGELQTVSREFSAVLAASDRTVYRSKMRYRWLLPGSGLELVGSVLGHRRFAKLKASLIGL